MGDRIETVVAEELQHILSGIGKGVVVLAGDIRHHPYGPGVREILLGSTLHLVHIRLQDVLVIRIKGVPAQLHITRHAVLRVLHLLRRKTVDLVISGNHDRVGFETLFDTAVLVDPYIEIRIEMVLYGVLHVHQNLLAPLCLGYLL